ncbi:hypothetical protein KSW81_001592 [Nannochloris sp. 'desiccata']|nr:hypothetical protein KSW81_001592 [Chlorella desiccata (nom. nud.)]
MFGAKAKAELLTGAAHKLASTVERDKVINEASVLMTGAGKRPKDSSAILFSAAPTCTPTTAAVSSKEEEDAPEEILTAAAAAPSQIPFAADSVVDVAAFADHHR